MKIPNSLALYFAVLLCSSASSPCATLNLLSVTDEASSSTRYLAGTTTYFARDDWSGSYDLGVTGITSGGSSLPNPGNESSGSGSFYADHAFSASSWDLSGWATGSIDAGLGNLGNTFPTIAQTTGVGASIQFWVDSPFTLTLTSSLLSQATGSGNQGQGVNNGASVRLFASVLDGVLTNQYLADWQTFLGSDGGTYTNSFQSGLFTLYFGAGLELSSNIPDAVATQYSSYDLNLSVVSVPEPGSVMLLAAAGLWPLVRRRREGNP